ncbi:MAG: hypothetical protein ACXABY_33225 [Candidatus Thorarchaeota archaeon]|jgi:hypothetical protein
MKKEIGICIVLLLFIAWVVSVDLILHIQDRRDADAAREEVIADDCKNEVTPEAEKMSFVIRPENWKK